MSEHYHVFYEDEQTIHPTKDEATLVAQALAKEIAGVHKSHGSPQKIKQDKGQFIVGHDYIFVEPCKDCEDSK